MSIKPPTLLDEKALADGLDDVGFAVVRGLLSASERDDYRSLYATREHFRSHIDMHRYGFGQGEYRYFTYPLPPHLQHLRVSLYAALVPIANRWRERLGQAPVLPESLFSYLRQCHDAGQKRPTPLLLRYGAGDYNRLHQDFYGELQFPIQVAVLLN